VQGDQLGVNYADNIRLDQSANTSGVKATLNNQTAEFENNLIKTVTVDTEGGANRVQIAGVPAGVNVNVDSFGRSNDQVIVGTDGTGPNAVDIESLSSLTSMNLFAGTNDYVYGPAAWRANVSRTHS